MVTHYHVIPQHEIAWQHVHQEGCYYACQQVCDHNQDLELRYALLQGQHDIPTGPQELLRLLLQQTRA